MKMMIMIMVYFTPKKHLGNIRQRIFLRPLKSKKYKASQYQRRGRNRQNTWTVGKFPSSFCSSLPDFFIFSLPSNPIPSLSPLHPAFPPPYFSPLYRCPPIFSPNPVRGLWGKFFNGALSRNVPKSSYAALNRSTRCLGERSASHRHGIHRLSTEHCDPTREMGRKFRWKFHDVSTPAAHHSFSVVKTWFEPTFSKLLNEVTRRKKRTNISHNFCQFKRRSSFKMKKNTYIN